MTVVLAARRPRRTRFAPSPTGDLHLGGVWVALASSAMAEPAGSLVLRVEDLDRPRVLAGSETRIVEDLRWLGIAWNEGPDVGGPWAPYRQSERTHVYELALNKLKKQGHLYQCDCSRAEIARAASAPHEGEESPRYPGTCRDRDPRRSFRRPPALRLRTDRAGTIAFEDGVRGHVEQNLETEVGDFVVRRGDGIFAYQLAVAVDDAGMGITDVVRGADLVASTPRQIYLIRLLGEIEPRYWHLPLVLSARGERLAKRTPGATARELRARGVAPEAVVGRLAHALGLAATGAPCSTRELPRFTDDVRWPRADWRIPREWAG
jgi:glutamyl-tRNA synthetase